MTPTLSGRWQTRIVLLGSLGILITLAYMGLFGMLRLGPHHRAFYTLPMLLGYVALAGLLWDTLYSYIQTLRWDRDWPLSFAFVCAIVEGAVIFVLFRSNLLPLVAYHAGDWRYFLAHYGTIFWVTYWWQFGPMRVICPRWRFNGGELV